MDYDETNSYFENLGFELAEIDNQASLFMDLEDTNWGYYAIVTDVDGNIPSSIDQPIVWSVYDDNDSFQWSVTIENAIYLKTLFEETDNLDDILQSLQNLREDNILEYETY